MRNYRKEVNKLAKQNEMDGTYTEPVTAYLEPKTYKMLEAKAAEDERTLSSILRLLIKRYVSGDLDLRKVEE